MSPAAQEEGERLTFECGQCGGGGRSDKRCPIVPFSSPESITGQKLMLHKASLENQNLDS